MMQGSKYDRAFVQKRKKPEPQQSRTGPLNWTEMTEAEVVAFKRKVCVHCQYCGTTYGKSDWVKGMTCDYIFVTGHMRKCSPLDCVESGTFKPKQRGRRKRQLEEIRGIECYG